MNCARGFSSLLWSLLLLMCSVATLAACASAAKIRADAEVVKRDIAKARENGAYTCDPRDLAMAETHVDFAIDELDSGNWVRADDHIKIAITSVKRAIKNSPVDECGSKKTAAVAIQKSDRDGDGIPDIDDACPDVAGVPELKGCPKPIDTDGDGVTDDIDRCPNDPGPTENQGCPYPDRDKDGVPDREDECPDDPGPAALHGCPDSDSDGIVDKEDQCPHEPGPADSPQGKGCPRKFSLVKINREKKQIEIKDKIYFESGKWKILPKSFGVLNQVAQVLKDYPTMRLSIEGHTDSDGPDDLNQKLSENRAEAVKQYLETQRVEVERLQSIGYGESKPIASNRTARGKETNRRVEFRIVNE
jgi:OOP family OmpA-OmpF porin